VYILLEKLINKKVYTIIISLVLIYIIVIVFLNFYQRKIIYHPFVSSYSKTEKEFKYKEVIIETNDNLKLKSWFHEKDIKNKKTLVFFHGNAGDLSNRIYKLNVLKGLDINFLILAYRGFSGNLGKPSEKGLYEDAKSTLKWLNELGIKDNQIIIYGESLGASVAVEVSQNKNFSGIILEAPFTSMTRIGKKYYPIFPVNLILKDKFNTIDKLKNIKSPVMVLHGKKDKIVPFEMGEEVFDKLKKPKFSYFTKEDDHMMEFNEEMFKNLKSFLDQLT